MLHYWKYHEQGKGNMKIIWCYITECEIKVEELRNMQSPSINYVQILSMNLVQQDYKSTPNIQVLQYWNYHEQVKGNMKIRRRYILQNLKYCTKFQILTDSVKHRANPAPPTYPSRVVAKCSCGQLPESADQTEHTHSLGMKIEKSYT